MRVEDGTTYLSIGDIARELGVTTLTIKRWIQWGEENGIEMPERYYFGAKKTRYFTTDATEQLREFKANRTHGDMAEFSRQFWGKRGKDEPAKLKS